MSRTESHISVLANTEAFLPIQKERPREIPKGGHNRKAEALLLNTEGSPLFFEIFTPMVLAALHAEVDLDLQLSSHIAEVIRDDRELLADLIIDELRGFRRGEPLRYSNSLAEFKLMA
ncbi:hypothetical protein BH09VER1_BH09VER1_46360 [soil metagenome]